LVTRFQLQFDPDIPEYSLWDFMIQYSELGRFGFINQPTYQRPVSSSKPRRPAADPQKIFSLARCREKAIKLDTFSKLDEAIRSQVFHELLGILLIGNLPRQELITQSTEFSALPPAEQASLLRLIACKGFVYDKNNQYTQRWLSRAQELCPGNRQGAYQMSLYRFNPGLFRISLYVRNFLHLKLS